MYTDEDLENIEQAIEDGICPLCGGEIDNPIDDCDNPIHQMV